MAGGRASGLGDPLELAGEVERSPGVSGGESYTGTGPDDILVKVTQVN